jgi:hypothetical protein
MKDKKYFNEHTFINELYSRIVTAFPQNVIERDSRFEGYSADIAIKKNNGQNIIIEVRNASSYSSLPFSTLVQLQNMVV